MKITIMLGAQCEHLCDMIMLINDHIKPHRCVHSALSITIIIMKFSRQSEFLMFIQLILGGRFIFYLAEYLRIFISL
jgi:hypothetical protein